MKGYIPVDLPTKTYIKAYILHQLGSKPVLDRTNFIGLKLYDLLQHSTNERAAQYSNTRYKCSIRVYISRYVYDHRGGNLNETNIKSFNFFLERKIKHRFYELMDERIEAFPSFQENLFDVRKKLGIDIEAWDDDSMKKDYYRYRKATGKPLIYKKTFAQLVPSGNATYSPF